MSSHIEAATEAVVENIGAWAPENAIDLDLFLAGLPALFEALASSVAGVAERLGAYEHDPVPGMANRAACGRSRRRWEPA